MQVIRYFDNDEKCMLEIKAKMSLGDIRNTLCDLLVSRDMRPSATDGYQTAKSVATAQQASESRNR
jgi:hypothetical protein